MFPLLLRLLFNKKSNSSIRKYTTYKVEGMTGPELQKTLWDKERLQPRSVGKELMRHSVHIYNKKTEIDRTFNVIKSLS